MPDQLSAREQALGSRLQEEINQNIELRTQLIAAQQKVLDMAAEIAAKKKTK